MKKRPRDWTAVARRAGGKIEEFQERRTPLLRCQNAMDENGGQPEGDNASDRTCKRCGSPLEFKMVFPRTSENPQYRIFGCTACDFLEWIAEHVDS